MSFAWIIFLAMNLLGELARKYKPLAKGDDNKKVANADCTIIIQINDYEKNDNQKGIYESWRLHNHNMTYTVWFIK